LMKSAVPFPAAMISTNVQDGDALAEIRNIRRMPGWESMRVVLLASRANKLSSAELREAGVVTVLHKPVRQYYLRRALEAVADNPEVIPPIREIASIRTSRVAGAKPKVLIAEDNALNRRLALRLMEKLGFQADCVNNGAEAIDAVGRGCYDVVLMDCQMPEVDGLEATRAIREEEGAAKRTPIIAMTANVFHGERERCLAAGMDDYLAKPVDIKVLADTLRRWTECKPAVLRSTGVGRV